VAVVGSPLAARASVVRSGFPRLDRVGRRVGGVLVSSARRINRRGSWAERGELLSGRPADRLRRPDPGDDLDPQCAYIDAGRASKLWTTAVDSSFTGPPVWVHGDVVLANLLAVDGRLSAIIDFGCCAVGDPACDLAIAWTAFDGRSRDVFLSGVGCDPVTRARACGWALWKALVTRRQGSEAAEASRRRFGWRWPVLEVIERVLDDS